MQVKDFLLTMAGALTGSGMALAGTYLQASMTQSKEIAAERRVKLEQLLESVQMMDYCRLEFTRDARPTPECLKARPNDKALAISVLYFPYMTKSFGVVNEAIAKNKEYVSRCRSDGSTNPAPIQSCVEPFIRDDRVASAIADFTVDALKQMSHLASK